MRLDGLHGWLVHGRTHTHHHLLLLHHPWLVELLRLRLSSHRLLLHSSTLYLRVPQRAHIYLACLKVFKGALLLWLVQLHASELLFHHLSVFCLCELLLHHLLGLHVLLHSHRSVPFSGLAGFGIAHNGRVNHVGEGVCTHLTT